MIKTRKPHAVRLDQVTTSATTVRYIGYVVDSYGLRMRRLGTVSEMSFHDARAAAGEKWPAIKVEKFYG